MRRALGLGKRAAWLGAFFLLATFVAIFFFEKNDDNEPPTLTLADLKNLPTLQPLDIILREGVDLDSAVIAKISHSPWTHVGIVINNAPIEIIHASTTDTNNRVARSTLADFLKNARRIAIKRYVLKDGDEAKIADFLIQQIGKDFTFNKESPLYCTTLIAQSFAPTANLNLPYQKVDAPIFGGDYLMPKAFYDDTNSTLIFEIAKNPR